MHYRFCTWAYLEMHPFVYLYLFFNLFTSSSLSSSSSSRGSRACLQHYLPHARRDLTLHHQGYGHLHLPAAHRSVCWHCSFQLPCHDSSVDVPHRHGLRQHLPDEALRTGPRMHHAPGQTAPGRRGTRWYNQHHPRPARRWVCVCVCVYVYMCVCPCSFRRTWSVCVMSTGERSKDDSKTNHIPPGNM